MLFLLLSIAFASEPVPLADAPAPEAVALDLSVSPESLGTTPRARVQCAKRLVAVSGAVTAVGLALLGTAIYEADNGRDWEGWVLGGGGMTGMGLSLLVNLQPLIVGRQPKNNLEC